MEYARQFEFGSNPMRLSWGHWVAVVAVLAPVLFGLSAMWRWIEPFEPRPDYRLPYEFSQDYWQCGRWFRSAAGTDAVLVVGDSVVWGEYAGVGETLTGRLNALSGKGAFANLGVNGLHPAAMAGMLRHHGGMIRGRRVMVVLNVLWMSSPKHDLREAPGDWEEAQASFNHPALVAQFRPAIPRYAAPFEQRAGILVGRAVPVFEWVSHIKAKSAAAGGRPADHAREAAAPVPSSEPRIDDPLPRFLDVLTAAVPAPAAGPHGQAVSWEERGIPVSSIAWPGANESLQWRFFREVVALLRSRGNRVCVFLSPFNPHLLSPESRGMHDAMVGDMAAQLAREGVAVFRGTPPPTGEYADASHPLGAGYARLAGELFGNTSFQAWLSEDRPMGNADRRK